MDKEYESLKNNETLDYVSLPPERRDKSNFLHGKLERNIHGIYQGEHWWLFLVMQAKETIVWDQAIPHVMEFQVEIFHTITEVQKMQVKMQNQQHFLSYLELDWNKVERFTCNVSWN